MFNKRPEDKLDNLLEEIVRRQAPGSYSLSASLEPEMPEFLEYFKQIIEQPVPEVDLLPFTCYTMASNILIQPLLGKLYEKNRVEYYLLAKANPYYDHPILTSKSITKEIAAQKALGILLKNDPLILKRLYQGGWHDLYNFINKSKTIHFTELFFNKTLGLISKQVDKSTSNSVVPWGTMLVAISNLLGKQIEVEDPTYRFFLHKCKEDIDHWGQYKFSIRNFHKEHLAVSRKYISRVCEEVEIEKLNFNSFENVTDPEFSVTFNAFRSLMDTETLSLLLLEDQLLTNKDTDEIMIAFFDSYVRDWGNDIPNDTEDDISELLAFLPAAYMFKALLKAYKNLKKEYAKNSKENLYLALETAQNAAKKAIEDNTRLHNELAQLRVSDKKEIETLQKQINSEYTRSASEFKALIKNQETQLDERDQLIARLQSENNELKTMVESMITLDSIEEREASSPEPIELHNIRGIIVGGHERWHAQLREALPDWRLIPPGAVPDLNLISNADVIFFKADHLSHYTFWTVMNECRRRGIPVGYIKKSNKEDCIREITCCIKGQRVS